MSGERTRPKLTRPRRQTRGRRAPAGPYHVPRKFQPIREWLEYFPEMPTLKQWERMLVEEALRRTFDNKSYACELLGCTREGLRKMLYRMGLTARVGFPPGWRARQSAK